MKRFGVFLAATAALLAAWGFGLAHAQVVTPLPQFVAPRASLDLGNGPTEIRILTGQMGVQTSQGSGTGTASSTSVLTLAAPASPPPCVGCALSGGTIPAGITVAAYTAGATTLNMSSALTVATPTTVSWGSACPAVTSAGGAPSPVALLQAAVGGDTPLYTTARVCAYGNNGPGGQFVTFVIGAH